MWAKNEKAIANILWKLFQGSLPTWKFTYFSVPYYFSFIITVTKSAVPCYCILGRMCATSPKNPTLFSVYHEIIQGAL
jgi:hypothetical protein